MKKLFLGFVLVFATLFTSVLAEDNPRAVIIFDASGSMWGQINGVTKLEIARDALKNVVREWNPSVELGLTVYGHRTKGDCNDIESIIPVGKIDKNRVIRTVMSIKPKGKTPISRSLRKVAEEIKYTEEKATIILISDGKETCDPDPCGTAKELEAQGIDFVTHVIGFNVDKKTSEQLECIANATGGEYFSAKNASALNKAMKVIAKKVEVVAPTKPKPVVKKLKNNIEVSASEKEDGKWVKARHYIYQDEEGKAGKRAGGAHSQKKKVGTDTLPVGKYILRSSYNAFKKDTPFEIKAGEVTKIHVIFGQYMISAKCPNMGSKINYEIYASSGQLVYEKKTGCSDTLKVTLDNGDYSVEAKVENDTKEVKFTVGGDSSKLVIDMTDIKREPTKEELIKADTHEETVPAAVTHKKESVPTNEKEETSTGKLNIGDKQVQIEGLSKEDMKSIQNLGALLGGAGGVQKSLESKPMQGIKESLIVALPYMEKTKECYGVSHTLEEAQKCDVIANEGAKVAQEKMQSVVGMKGKMAKTIAHTEWSEEIRVKELAREEKDIKNAKLYIVCIDKGVGMGQLKECAANNGEFEPKKTEIEQLGDMLKMFGGMK